MKTSPEIFKLLDEGRKNEFTAEFHKFADGLLFKIREMYGKDFVLKSIQFDTETQRSVEIEITNNREYSFIVANYPFNYLESAWIIFRLGLFPSHTSTIAVDPQAEISDIALAMSVFFTPTEIVNMLLLR